MKKILTRCSALLIVLNLVCALCFPLVGYANSSKTANAERKSRNELASYVASSVADNTYELAGGGSVKGSLIYSCNGSSEYGTFTEANYNKLTSESQTRLLQDMLKAMDNDKFSTKTYDGAKKSWLGEVNKHAGSDMLTAILAGQQPDYATAKTLYAPIQKPINTLLGLGSIITVSVLALSMVADLIYMSLPPISMMMGDDPKYISREAKYAVNQSGSGEKEPLGIYFKKKAIQMCILGICLLYLIQGRIYNLVQMILNLLSGFV